LAKRNKEVSRQKIKAISPNLENYGALTYLNPTSLRLPGSQTPFADCFTNNPMVVLRQGLGYV